MKVLLVNQSDIQGGAARAAHRLHMGLRRAGVSSHLLVQEQSSRDRHIVAPRSRLSQSIAHARIAVDALPLKRYPQRSPSLFSLQWLPDHLLPQINTLQPDIINLHWTGEALLRIETIGKIKHPVVWTLHDMWAFTGGCHYSQGCDRFQQQCGCCPALGSTRDQDLSRWVWQRKAKAWKDLNPTVVALSTWLADCARSSSLFQHCRVEQIPNGLDTAVYRPLDRTTARHLLNLPTDRQLVLFGALQATSDKRKGFHLLQPALESLRQNGWGDRLGLVVMGATEPEQPLDLGFPIYYLGTLNDDLSLALVYSAADVFVLPSLEENLANTVMEAIACGIPSVAFQIGGMPDLIEHERNGYLAHPFQVDDLAAGIAWVLEQQERHRKLSEYARAKTEREFTLEIQSRCYLKLFDDLLKRQPQPSSRAAPHL